MKYFVSIIIFMVSYNQSSAQVHLEQMIDTLFYNIEKIEQGKYIVDMKLKPLLRDDTISYKVETYFLRYQSEEILKYKFISFPSPDVIVALDEDNYLYFINKIEKAIKKHKISVNFTLEEALDKSWAFEGIFLPYLTDVTQRY